MLGSESIQAAGGQATLASLRHATASRHACVESLTGLASPFGIVHYGHVVQGFQLFVRQWEPLIARVLPQHLLPWFSRGRRADLLQCDLRSLGLHPLATDAGAAPRLETPAQALGSLYVMEGSALGGQVIAAQLRHRLGLDATRGAAYFHGCGEGTAARWREFRQHLSDELDALPDSRPQAVQGAIDTFDSLIALFRRILHERPPA